MSALLSSYLPVVIFIGVALAVGVALIVAPFLAMGLYEKSRAIGEGRTIGLDSMILTRPRAGAQALAWPWERGGSSRRGRASSSSIREKTLADQAAVGGVRAGLGAETPVGPVRFEYGYGTEDRGAVYVRLGRWF